MKASKKRVANTLELYSSFSQKEVNFGRKAFVLYGLRKKNAEETSRWLISYKN